MNIGELFVSITARTSGLDQGIARTTQSMGGLSSMAAKLAPLMAGAFAVDKIKDFGVASVRAFADSQQTWDRLGGALQNMGVNFESVRGQIESAADAMARSTTIGDDDFAASLTRLAQLSGDFSGSMSNMALVADLAAGANIDLSTAADLVGKAMAGNTSLLERQFPALRGSTDALGELRTMMAGMAANEGKTLGGQLSILKDAWGEFQEAVGGALSKAGEGSGIIGLVSEALRSMASWVQENGDQLKLLVSAVVGAGRATIDFVTAGIRLYGEMRSAVVSMVDGIQAQFDRIAGIFSRAKQSVVSVGDSFRDLFNRVVGNSYVPDMIDGIAVQFGRLNTLMVNPTLAAVGQVNAAFAGLGAGTESRIRSLGDALKSAFKLPNIGDLTSLLSGLNPITMGVNVISGALGGLLSKGVNSLLGSIGGAIGGLFGFGKSAKKADFEAASLAKTFNSLNRASVTNLPEIVDMLRLRRALTPGSSTPLPTPVPTSGNGPRSNPIGSASAVYNITINNPGAGVNADELARQVENAIINKTRLGGHTEFSAALRRAG